MSADLEAIVRELRDRQEIFDCLMRYCRGIDRLDRAELLSAYHADALDDHGAYVGPVEGFWDFVFKLHSTQQHRTQHHITNHRCEIDGDTAHSESYYIFRSLNKEPPLHTTASGRYLDRFERRDGRWAIAARICLVEISNDFWAPTGLEAGAGFMPATRDKGDTSYKRPWTIDPGRFTV
jgi:SnoaL-like domain